MKAAAALVVGKAAEARAAHGSTLPVNNVDNCAVETKTRAMDIDVVDPALRTALLKLPALDVSKRLPRLIGRVGPRLLTAPPVEGVTISERRHGALRMRIYRPTGANNGPGLLWVHGGGLVIGAMKQDDRLCAGTAGELGLTVVSVEYRLAPEHPFPAALDDVLAGWNWLQAHARELGVNPARVVVGGESAGAGIAACLVQRLHDDAAVQPIAQWLFAPMLDDRTADRRELDDLDHWVWNNRANRFGWGAYLAGAPAPYAVAARRESLTGLPPTWLCVGDIELFHGEVVEYADRLRAAGVDVTLDLIPGGAHGFENWAADSVTAQALLQRARFWLSRQTDSIPQS